MDRLPAGFLGEVLEAKNYKQAKAMTDAADTAEARRRLPQSPMFDAVTEIEFALAEEAMRANE